MIFTYKVVTSDGNSAYRGLTLTEAENMLETVKKRDDEAVIERDHETVERLDGLVRQDLLKAMLRSTEELIHDLCHEGFEVDEAIEYLCNQVKENGPYA